MKTSIRQILSAALALTLAMGPAAQASVALGHDLHATSTDLSVGTGITKGQFWSDTYSDLRTEHFLTYTPNSDVVPTAAYGNTIISRDTLSGMAKTLEQQGDRVVGGINGDYYAFSTGAPNGIVITDAAARGTGPWASGPTAPPSSESPPSPFRLPSAVRPTWWPEALTRSAMAAAPTPS